jgi:hypothetical protein
MPSQQRGFGAVPKKKLIFYSNSRKRLMRYKELYLFNLVIVHGELFREQKFHNIETFCMQDDLSTVDVATGKTILFVPRILFSTTDIAGAGLDNLDIHSVHRDGYPSSLLDFIQEGGCTAHYPGALPSDIFVKNPGPPESSALHKFYTTLSTYVKPGSDEGFNQLALSFGVPARPLRYRRYSLDYYSYLLLVFWNQSLLVERCVVVVF